MPEVTMEWLQQNAKQLVKKYWNTSEIPTILLATRQNTITIEKKLDWDKYTGYYCGDIKTVILNNENNTNRTLRSIKRTLLHELVHWRLHTTSQPHRDSDERFARELIRVGLGRRHNGDEQALLAAKQAWKSKKDEYFELIEKNESETISIRMSHHRKSVDDFKKDLANTLIKINNQREDEDDSIYPADVADKMKEWYGYRLYPIARYGIVLSAGGSYWSGNIGDRDDIEQLLTELDVDLSVIDKKLKNVASED